MTGGAVWEEIDRTRVGPEREHLATGRGLLRKGTAHQRPRGTISWVTSRPVDAQRLRDLALLRRGDLSVTEVCFEVGCASLGTFSTRFTERCRDPANNQRT